MFDMKYEEVLEFWFHNSKKWFNGGKEFDDEICQKFEKLFNIATKGELDTWMDNPASCLALIIVLDQFTRNMFREDKKSFEYDFKALYVSKIALKNGYLDILEGTQKTFLLMPLMHSESLPDQELCIESFEKLALIDSSYEMNVSFAMKHRDIIAKFGRFPHRNKVLGRESTDEEIEFMKTHSGF